MVVRFVVKTDARHLSQEAQEDLRPEAVYPISDQGMGQVETVWVIGVARISKYRWLKADRSCAPLASRPAIAAPNLRRDLAATIVRMIEGRSPDQLRLLFVRSKRDIPELYGYRWNVELAIRVIKQTFGALGLIAATEVASRPGRIESCVLKRRQQGYLMMGRHRREP